MTFTELLQKVGPSPQNGLLPRINLDNETHIQLYTQEGNVIEITNFGNKTRVTVVLGNESEYIILDEERQPVLAIQEYEER